MMAFLCIYLYMDGCSVADSWGCHAAGQKELSTSMLVLGIWAQKGSDGQKVLAALGFNDDKASELAASVSSLVQH
jgi:hypothetical protein